jgi:hypothetical protein
MSSIPAATDRLAEALTSRSRGASVGALEDLRSAGASLDLAARTTLDGLLSAGGGLLRGSRFGRVLEVVDAALILDDTAGDDAGWGTMAAAVDMLAVSVPPSRSRASPISEDRDGWLGRWACRTEDWGRPAITAGAAFRVDGRVPGLGLLEAVERSFSAPRSRVGAVRDPAWIPPTADGVVQASIALLIAAPGFREAAALLVARGAWAVQREGSAVTAARVFVDETREWGVRRGRLPRDFSGVLGPGVGPSRGEFVTALRDASTREAVHSFGVLHSLAAALAELESRGSRPLVLAAGRALLASRPTWSPGRPTRAL